MTWYSWHRSRTLSGSSKSGRTRGSCSRRRNTAGPTNLSQPSIPRFTEANASWTRVASSVTCTISTRCFSMTSSRTATTISCSIPRSTWIPNSGRNTRSSLIINRKYFRISMVLFVSLYCLSILLFWWIENIINFCSSWHWVTLQGQRCLRPEHGLQYRAHDSSW